MVRVKISSSSLWYYLNSNSWLQIWNLCNRIGPRCSAPPIIFKSYSDNIKIFRYKKYITENILWFTNSFMFKFYRKLPVSDVTVGEYNRGCKTYVLLRSFIHRTGQVSAGVTSKCNLVTHLNVYRKTAFTCALCVVITECIVFLEQIQLTRMKSLSK